MQFQFTPQADNLMTSNITYALSRAGIELLHGRQDIFNPDVLEDVFGDGDMHCFEPERGYYDPEFYFKGPGGTLLGISWRFGHVRLRGSMRSLDDQFIPASDICDSFVRELVEHINNFQSIKE